MLASNPVDPSQVVRINYQGPAGPSVPFPRDDEGGLTSSLGMLAAGSLLAVGFVVAAFAGAQAPVAAPADVPAVPAAKAPGVVVDAKRPGEFYLAPGNNRPPGVVVRLGVPEPFPGDFRLAPGNNQPLGIVPAR